MAAKLSKGLRREIVNVKLNGKQSVKQWLKAGAPEHVAKLMSRLETRTAVGTEDREDGSFEKVTGQKPQYFDAWVKEKSAAGAWD